MLEATKGKDWAQVRNVALAKNYASRALHIIDPANFPNADSWAKGSERAQASTTTGWLSGPSSCSGAGEAAAKRIVFVVDEVGQYVARSIPRMFDLQGLAEAFQKKRGPLWLVVTSQEKLSDVVDSLESRQVEYARVQDRFPLRVDLLPSDIHEVTSRRVLDKTDAGQTAVRDRLAAHRGQLNTYVRLESPTRAADLAEDEFVRLYPLVPYQVQLLIDAVSARRAQGGGSPMLGGSNRTIIKLAQQLVIDPSNGLGDEEVGALVTLDRASRLLEEAIPTSWRSEIEQVADKYTPEGTETHIMQAVALCSDVPALALTEANLAALLHPAHRCRELPRPRSADALVKLVGDDRLRAGDDGYHIQSPEQKDWEKTRKGKEPRPADAIRIRKAMIRQALTGLSVTKGRSFKVELWVEGEKLADGDVALHVEEADTARREQLRNASREEAAANRVTWLYSLDDETYRAIEEWYRSDEMIKSKDTPSKTTQEVELLGEERQRLGRIERQLIDRLSRDMTAGQVAFRGTLDDAPAGTIAQAAQKLMTDRIASHLRPSRPFRGADLDQRCHDRPAHRRSRHRCSCTHRERHRPRAPDPSGVPDRHRHRPARRCHEDREERDQLRPSRHRRHPRYQARRTASRCPSRGRAGACALRPSGRACSRPPIRAPRSARPPTTGSTGSSASSPTSASTSFAPPSAGPSVETRVEVAASLDKLTGTKSPIDTAGLAAALAQLLHTRQRGVRHHQRWPEGCRPRRCPTPSPGSRTLSPLSGWRATLTS